VICVLCGCAHSEKEIEQAFSLREKLLSANGCTFKSTISADYQSVYYTFTMSCKVDKTGMVLFEVLEPDSIRGITGCVSSTEGNLTFDDQVLLFATLPEGQITPVSAPWLFINALRSGYIKGCSKEKDGYTLQIDDSYAEDAVLLNIQIADDMPTYVEIIWKNRRVMSLEVEDFVFL
jgi:hypothetical protein